MSCMSILSVTIRRTSQSLHKRSLQSPENAFCNKQVAEVPCTTFNSLVPALLQSGTGAPRRDVPLCSLPIRLTVVKIRPVTSPYRRLPRYTTCSPPTLTSYHHTCLPLPTFTALCHWFSGPWPQKMQRHNATFRKETNQAKKKITGPSHCRCRNVLMYHGTIFWYQVHIFSGTDFVP